MVLEHTQLDFSGQHVFVGLDVHKHSWNVTILVEDLTHKTFAQPPDVDLLVKYLHRHFPKAEYHCVYEAGYCGFWIHDALGAHGVDCRVINAADVPTTDKEKRTKTNKVDSRKLARSLRNGELRAIYAPSRRALEDRTLVRTRRTLVSKQTRCKNQIKGLLMFYGVSVPEDLGERYWSKRYLAWLESLRMQYASGDRALELLLRELSQFRQSILEITRAIRTLSQQEPYATHVANLVTISGISTVTAMILLTELVTVSRFRSLDELASYVGLVPGEKSSGEDRTITDITQRKNAYLRWVLVESAWIAVRLDPTLMLAFTKLTKRMPANRAIIRIARKLLNRIRFVLKNQQPYTPLTQVEHCTA
jgi:transposase